MKYHKDIYLPPEAKDLSFSCLLRYTRHARREADTDKRGKIRLPSVFDTKNAEMIEVTMRGNKVYRALYRMDYDKDKDLCMVIEPENRVAVTVWLNSKDDQHYTLDKSKYVKYDGGQEV